MTIGNKEWIVDKARPFQLKTALGVRPLYLLKWNSLAPMNFEIKENTKTYTRMVDGKEETITVAEKELKEVDPKFDTSSKVTPEILKTTQDGRFLKHMKKYAGGAGGGIFGEEGGSMLPLILGVVGGAVLIYVLLMLKLIPVPV